MLAPAAERKRYAEVRVSATGEAIEFSTRFGTRPIVEMILTEQQLACLKAAVPLDSEELAALNRAQRFGGGVTGPRPIAVSCTLVTAGRLLKMAQRSCPDVVPEIRAAMEEARQEQTIGAISEQPPADLNATTLRLSTDRLQRAVELFANYHLEATYPQVLQALNAELGRRAVGAAWRAIIVDRRHLSGLPFSVKEILQIH
jgi:hypothetical protein